MLKANRIYIVLLTAFIFSFIYRLLLMLWEGFPPGADIGLHNSVIHSITGSGNANFFYNFYHMGGGVSLTFPGYHIFATGIILMTGLPEYIAHVVIVSLFSSLVVLVGYLITKLVWSESAAIIVTFLVAISRFDIEMLMWGGYPNVITLLMIPLTFYLYLRKEKFSATPFLVSTSILAGSIFLTHSLSAAMYVSITTIVVLFVTVKPKIFGASNKISLYWFLPIILGALLFFPFIIQAVPEYLNNNSSLSSDSTSSIAIKAATVATQQLPLSLILPLFGVLAGFLIFSKKYAGRFLALPTFLLSVWVFLPLVLTQTYLIDFPIDYNRFLYFLILPLIIFIAVLIDHGSSFFTHLIIKYRSATNQVKQIKRNANKKIAKLSAIQTHWNLYSGFILFFLLLSFIALPIFMSPIYYNSGQTIQSFYQLMDNQLWDAIQWTKTNTSTFSVFVSDALYGWWFGGFAQRRTLSAVDPQYLTINGEYNKSLFAKSLLDTDFLIDNSLIQVRDDGGYIPRHNPEIVVKLNWTYFPVSFFVFASNETRINYSVNGEDYSESLDTLVVKEMFMENELNQASIFIARGNDFFNYTQQTTVYKGQRFVNLTTTIDSAVPGVSLNNLIMDVQSKVNQTISYNNNRTFGLFDEPYKVLAQLIFEKNQPIMPFIIENGVQHRLHLEYNLNGNPNAEIQISASAYSVSDDLDIYKDINTKNAFLANQMTNNLNPNQDPDDTKDWEQVFNYKTEMQAYDVSYIACRNPEMFPKFVKDPLFSLVFINSGVAIFKVDENLKSDR
jgi:hypothetical protein